MSIKNHLNKDNLHHAYLIEGAREDILEEVLKSIEGEIVQFSFETLKIEDARAIKSHALEKSMSGSKRFFVISANNFLLEAQNSLLKLFEEPIENTYFFVVTPDASILLKTLISRFYFISEKSDLAPELKNAEKFIKMPLKSKLDFIKELLVEEAPTLEEVGVSTESVGKDGSRAKALKFLNALESALHSKVSKGIFDTSVFHHFFKVREFLRMPGSSPKTLMESVALMIPEKFSK